MIERVSNHTDPGAAASGQVALSLRQPEAANLTFSTVTIDGAGSLRQPATDLLPGFRDASPVLQTTHGIRGRDLRR